MKMFSDYINYEILAIARKSVITIPKSIEYNNNLIHLYYEDSIVTINISQLIKVIYKESYIKVYYTYITTIKGTLTKVEGKFIEIRINDKKRNDTYHTILSTNALEGFKVYSNDTNDNEVEGDSNES